MASVHDIPPRYEQKYLLTAEQATQVRRAIAPHCALDFFSAKEADHRYLITSLYLDTPTLGLYRAWERGAHRRFKLRVRRYGELLGDSPVFLEVKDRVGDVTIKRRTVLHAAQWLHQARDGRGGAGQARDFHAKRDLYQCGPSLLVSYRREAWKGRIESYARVTFDSEIRTARCDQWSLVADGALRSADSVDATRDVGEARVLLELKFEREVPRWMAYMARSMGLVRRGFSKYGTGAVHAFDAGARADAARRTSSQSSALLLR